MKNERVRFYEEFERYDGHNECNRCDEHNYQQQVH